MDRMEPLIIGLPIVLNRYIEFGSIMGKGGSPYLERGSRRGGGAERKVSYKL
jgi:hypothetical protein